MRSIAWSILFALLVALMVTSPAVAQDNCQYCEVINGAPDCFIAGTFESGFCNCEIPVGGKICRENGFCFVAAICNGGDFQPDALKLAPPPPTGIDDKEMEIWQNLNVDGGVLGVGVAAYRVTGGAITYLSLMTETNAGVTVIRDYASDGQATVDVTTVNPKCPTPQSIPSKYMVPTLKIHLRCAFGVEEVDHRRRSKPDFMQN